jgi:RND family efflux transporter MFP subunit
LEISVKLSAVRYFLAPGALCAFVIGISAGCRQKPSQVAVSSGPPVIPVSYPVRQKVVEFVDFTGRTEPVSKVSVRPGVTGFLVELPNHFKEGSEVKAGDLLFKVDPQPFQAVVDQAKSQLAGYQAQLKLAKVTLDRDKSSGAIAVSPQQIDQDKATVEAAEARVKGAQATLDAANVNLKYTEVKAAISGRTSRIFFTPGNSVTAYSTILTSIVSMDPMYAYFEIDERSYHKYLKTSETANVLAAPFDLVGFAAGSLGILGLPPVNPVYMALEGEETFPWVGSIDFINNQVNSSTGTVAVRGIFQNTRPQGGPWRIIPGMFVRIRLPMGKPEEKLLVIDRAIGSDQGLKFVYVVDVDNKVQSRRVETGSLQENGLRVIEDYVEWRDQKTNELMKMGVKKDELIVVGGLPQIRPRMEIQPDPTTMPVLTVNDPTATNRTRVQPPPPSGKKQ